MAAIKTFTMFVKTPAVAWAIGTWIKMLMIRSAWTVTIVITEITVMTFFHTTPLSKNTVLPQTQCADYDHEYFFHGSLRAC
jgi:hypothetical protein